MHLKKLAETIRLPACADWVIGAESGAEHAKWFRDEYERMFSNAAARPGRARTLSERPARMVARSAPRVWRYVAHIARGEYDDAYRVIREANPFPSACARVCHHPCEQVCRAGATGGEPIASGR